MTSTPQASTGAGKRLIEAGYVLPAVPEPRADYLPAKTVGEFVFLSGQVPFVDNELQVRGRVGDEVSQEEGANQAALAALNALSAAHRHLGGLDDVEVASMTVYVASAPTFSDQHLVADGASKVVGVAFGPHPRTSVGVTALPLDAAVEVQLVLLVRRPSLHR
jgi:enamine deaminase RidA (YjgF/YER057c/UK114 family)